MSFKNLTGQENMLCTIAWIIKAVKRPIKSFQQVSI